MREAEGGLTGSGQGWPTIAGMSRISRDDVIHVARLARLELAESEVETFTGQLAAILDHAEDVAALDLAGVEPTSHPVPLINVLRSDEAGPTLTNADALASAPQAESGRFRVPTILGEEP